MNAEWFMMEKSQSTLSISSSYLPSTAQIRRTLGRAVSTVGAKMIEWTRILTIIIGFIIAIPVFFIGNTVRLYKRGRKVFHVKTRSSPPACLLDPKYGEHKYLTVNGVRLHYVESGDHSKPLVVFVHGWPQFWFAWRHQIEHFNKV